MHIALCDDNKNDLKTLSGLMECYRTERDSSLTYDTFYNATELLDTLTKGHFDLLMLDILMPGITGMDMANEIRSGGNEIPIIFLTSSRDFAVESYRVHAFDYIMKPVTAEVLFPALDKQISLFRKSEPYLTLKIGNGIVRVYLSQIVFVEVRSRVVEFTLVDGTKHDIYGGLVDYEAILLADEAFYKTHRSYIVNLRQVTGLGKTGFATTAQVTIPVARDSYSRAKAAYLKYLLTEEGRKG